MSWMRGMPLPEAWVYNAWLLVQHTLGWERTTEALMGFDDRLQRRIADRLASRGPGIIRPVQRLKRVDVAEFQRRWAHGTEPVLLEQAAAHWPAVQRWSFDWLSEHHGDAPIVWRPSEGVSGRNVPDIAESMSLAELIASIRRGERRYLRFDSLLDRRPALRDDFDVATLDALAPPSVFGNAFKFFLGGAGSMTRLHNAGTGNLFVMTHGHKRWRLYPGAYAPALRMRATRGNYNWTYADPGRPDDPEHPALPYLDGWACTLEPGDVLFVPPWVWHDVINEDESIGMSYRYADIPGALRASAVQTLLRVLSQDQPIWHVVRGMGRPEQAYQHGFQVLRRNRKR